MIYNCEHIEETHAHSGNFSVQCTLASIHHQRLFHTILYCTRSHYIPLQFSTHYSFTCSGIRCTKRKFIAEAYFCVVVCFFVYVNVLQKLIYVYIIAF